MTMEEKKIPAHIAMVMDGNGRWASQRGFSRSIGHRKGTETVRGAMEFCIDNSVDYLTLFAFSTENWKRSAAEVDAIMSLLREFLYSQTPEMNENRIKIDFIGDTSRIPASSQRAMEYARETTKNNDKLKVNIACNYGGRADILYATKEIARRAARGLIDPETLTEEDISASLYTSDFPDPDLLIRTGAEKRISNFMLWQLAYCEIYFTDTLWPDMDKEKFAEALKWFSGRQRRYGGVK